jgi:hypothetical protein
MIKFERVENHNLFEKEGLVSELYLAEQHIVAVELTNNRKLSRITMINRDAYYVVGTREEVAVRIQQALRGTQRPIF